ncbi:MAG: trimethylamine methyltransferase family protein [Gammaproteobacteria bacterium]|nr:trimethylamine methyltransferase family protein [Gammaproteobacteria bacterium]
MTRRSGREKRVVSAIRQLPFSRLVNPCAPIEVLSADHVKAIIYAALTILETRGMRFLEGGGRRLLCAGGAESDETTRMMQFDRGWRLGYGAAGEWHLEARD